MPDFPDIKTSMMLVATPLLSVTFNDCLREQEIVLQTGVRVILRHGFDQIASYRLVCPARVRRSYMREGLDQDV